MGMTFQEALRRAQANDSAKKKQESMKKYFTQEQLDAAVEEATKSLRAITNSMCVNCLLSDCEQCKSNHRFSNEAHISLTKHRFGRIMHDPDEREYAKQEVLKQMALAGGYENLGD